MDEECLQACRAWGFCRTHQPDKALTPPGGQETLVHQADRHGLSHDQDGVWAADCCQASFKTGLPGTRASQQLPASRPAAMLLQC